VTLDFSGSVGQYTSLVVVNGNPAISYYDQIYADLKYVRATDASGTSWGTPVTPESTVQVGEYTSLMVVNGNPAISYYDASFRDLKYVRATDASGTSWGTPVTFDSTGNVGQYTSLVVVNGSPAISYYDATNGNLKWATYGPHDIAVSQTAALSDGVGSVNFGTVVAGGSSAPLTFTITNPGTAELTNLAVTKYGTDSSDFTVSALSTTSIPVGGGTATFTVTFSPGSGGAKTASLQIASNVIGAKNPFDIALTGTGTAPDITVTQAGTLTDGVGSVAFSALVTGSSSAPLTFIIINPGTANLTNIAVTKDGTSNTSFAVSALSATNIPVGAGTATFTVTFSPSSGGAKTAAIHIASNVIGTKNPFDIYLTGTALAFSTDTDSDGLNDASEFQMAALGFDWQVSQPALVTTLTSNLNGAGYFTPAQVQALNVGTPLIQKNPTTGVFTITIGVAKSTDLNIFNPFPMSGPGTSTVINGQGKLEFQFTVPDNAAFFKVQAQ
jgi:hypothetical protein